MLSLKGKKLPMMKRLLSNEYHPVYIVVKSELGRQFERLVISK